MPRADDAWEGGYITRDGRGRPTFYIRRQVSGVRYDVSTRARNARAAFEQLKRFEADPSNYVPGGQPKGEALYLDAELVCEFLAWSRDVKRNSTEWINKQRLMLAWWADELVGRDLRRISLVGNIKPALAGATQRQHRIAVLKSLYSWLRKERNLLAVAEDPTFQTLPTPQSRPQQWTRDKVIPADDYLKVRELVAPHWRDGMDVQAATGWHVTELIRFAMSGAIAPAPDDEQEGTAGILVCPQTKAGEPLRTRVGPDIMGPASRLLERGMFTRRHYGVAINKACDEAGVPRFTPGRFRHTVATYAINRGADPASVAAFLNHKSARTTRRFYATHAAARRVPTLSVSAAP